MSVAQPQPWIPILLPLNPITHYVPLVPSFSWVCIQSPWASFPPAVGPLHPQQTDWGPFVIQQWENPFIVSIPVSDSGVAKTGEPSSTSTWPYLKWSSLDLTNAVCPHFSQREIRKRSFSSFESVRNFPDIEEFVTAGFHYAGYGDCVRCFYCGIGLKAWKADDVPVEEHARWGSDCSYLRQVKGDDYVESVVRKIIRKMRRTGARSMVAQTAFQDGSTIDLAAYRGGPVQESADNNNDRNVNEKNEQTVTVVQDTHDDMNVYFRSGINLNVER